MSARVFIHPRCLSGPALGALQAALEARGMDARVIFIGPPSPKGYCELVQLMHKLPNGVVLLQRFDGSQFNYQTKAAPPVEPEAA